MGVYSRDYFKENARGAWADWGLYSTTPVVKWLIIINVVVFLAEIPSYQVRFSMLQELRKQHPKLDKLLNEKGDSPESLQQIKKDHPELKQIIEAEEHDSVFVEGKSVSYVLEWCELDTGKVLRG